MLSGATTAFAEPPHSIYMHSAPLPDPVGHFNAVYAPPARWLSELGPVRVAAAEADRRVSRRRSRTLFVWRMSVMVGSYATMHTHDLLVIWSLHKASERRIAGLTVPDSMNIMSNE